MQDGRHSQIGETYTLPCLQAAARLDVSLTLLFHLRLQFIDDLELGFGNIRGLIGVGGEIEEFKVRIAFFGLR